MTITDAHGTRNGDKDAHVTFYGRTHMDTTRERAQWHSGCDGETTSRMDTSHTGAVRYDLHNQENE